MKAAEPYVLRLVRVVGPDFVAGFETDGVVRIAAPIIKHMIGMTDDKARQHVAEKGWRASIITVSPIPPRIVEHAESFEVQRDGLRAFFYFDENTGRRSIGGRPTKAAAQAEAQAYAGLDAELVPFTGTRPPF